MTTCTLTPPRETPVIGSSLSRLLHTLETVDHMNPDKAATLLQDANIDPMDLIPWYDLDHPVQDCYDEA